MILLVRKNGRSCPVVHCDHCGKRIEKTNLGMVLFDKEIDGEGETCRPLYLHKGACDMAMKLDGRVYNGWTELSNHLMYLAYNAGITPKKFAGCISGEDEIL